MAATLALTTKPAQTVTCADAQESGSSWLKKYQRLTDEIRLRCYSSKTLRMYRNYVLKLQICTNSIDPGLLIADHVKDYLADLAVKKQVDASTQNLAFNSLVFFIRKVLGKEFGKVDGGEGTEAPVYLGGFVTGRNRFHCG